MKAVPQEVRQWRRVTERALRASLKGEAPGQFPPLDWSGSTAFQCKVWQALLAIPAGGTVSYGELARSIGSPRAFRAVGGACGANPIPVLVPCHRVVASDGGLGGFSGGLSMKRQLLQIEGVAV